MKNDQQRMNIPPGYKFSPRDDELLIYLKMKIMNQPLQSNMIHHINLYESDPENIAEKYEPAAIGKNEWYLLTPRQKKFKTGSTPDRAAPDGYWKATSGDKSIKNNNAEEIGFKKSLRFVRGKRASGVNTDWLMIEYRLKNAPSPSENNDTTVDDFVICKMYLKNKKQRRVQERAREANTIDESDMVRSEKPNNTTTEEARTEVTHHEVPNPLVTNSLGTYEPLNMWTHPQPLDVPPFLISANPRYQVGNPTRFRACTTPPFDRQSGLISLESTNILNPAPLTAFGPRMNISPPSHRTSEQMLLALLLSSGAHTGVH